MRITATTSHSDEFKKAVKAMFGYDLEEEYKFHPTRRWRFDYAIVELKIAIEVEGGVWTRGRHINPTGFLKDMEKYNTATSMGWSIIRVVPNEMLCGNFLNMLDMTICNKKREV